MKPVFVPNAYQDLVTKQDWEQAVRHDLEQRGFSFRMVIDDIGVYYPPQVGRPLKVYVIKAGQMAVWVNRDYFFCQPGSRLIIPSGAIHWSRGGADGVTYCVGEHTGRLVIDKVAHETRIL